MMFELLQRCRDVCRNVAKGYELGVFKKEGGGGAQLQAATGSTGRQRLKISLAILRGVFPT